MCFQGDQSRDSFLGSGAGTVPCAHLPFTRRPATPNTDSARHAVYRLPANPEAGSVFGSNRFLTPHTCSTSLLYSSFNMTDVRLCSSYSCRKLDVFSARSRSQIMWKVTNSRLCEEVAVYFWLREIVLLYPMIKQFILQCK